MLEEAANMSISSQLSLFNSDLPSKPASHLQPVTVPALAQFKQSRNEEAPWKAGQGTLLPQILQSQKACENGLTHHMEEESDVEYEEVDSGSDGSEDLNETLKFSPSLARGVEFNDGEVWESFNHGSPRSRCRTESSGSDRTLPHASPASQKASWKSPLRFHTSPSKAVWKSPVRKEVLSSFRSPSGDGRQEEGRWREGPQDQVATSGRRSWEEKVGGFGDHRSGKSQVPEQSGIAALSHSSSGGLTSMESHLYENAESLRGPLPPPSALVSKLFPALKRVEEQPKKPFPNHHHQAKPRHASDNHTPFTKSPSPESSTEGDSGIRSLSSSTSVALSEDLKYKLNQLEDEIAKYRAENANLEKLRKERDNVSSYYLLNKGFDFSLSSPIRLLLVCNMKSLSLRGRKTKKWQDLRNTGEKK